MYAEEKSKYVSFQYMNNIYFKDSNIDMYFTFVYFS